MIINHIKFMREKEVSMQFGISLSWLRKLRYIEQSPPYYKLGRHVYYNEKELEVWLLNKLVPYH